MGDLYSDGPPRKGLSTGAIVALIVVGVVIIGIGTCVGIGLHSWSHYGEVPPNQVAYLVRAAEVSDPCFATELNVRITYNNDTGRQEALEITTTPWSQTYDNFQDGDTLYLRAENITEGCADLPLVCEVILGQTIISSDWDSDCTAQGTYHEP